MAGIALTQQLWVFPVMSVLKAMDHGVIHPALQAESIKLETPERSGVAMSTFLLGTDIVYMVGPILGAVVLDRSNYETMYLACIPMTLVAALGSDATLIATAELAIR